MAVNTRHNDVVITLARPTVRPVYAGKGVLRIAFLLIGLLVFLPSAHAATPADTRSTSLAEMSLRASGIYGEIFELAMEAYQDQDYRAAITLWTSIAGFGHAAAQYNLGVVHARGLSVPKNMSIASNWWRAAANQGNVDAQYNLGLLYATGNGVEMSMEKAVHWWQKAASTGDPAAQFNLGMMYARGDGVSKSMDAAMHWWSRSAAQQFPQAQRILDKLSSR